MARAASNTFAGIRPMDVTGFIIAQLCGAFVAIWLFTWLYPAAIATSAVDATDATDATDGTDTIK